MPGLEGDDDPGGDARSRAATGEAVGCKRPVPVLVPRDHEAREAGRRRERAEAAGRQRGGDGVACDPMPA